MSENKELTIEIKTLIILSPFSSLRALFFSARPFIMTFHVLILRKFFELKTANLDHYSFKNQKETL
jgi:hypothetical protein